MKQEEQIRQRHLLKRKAAGVNGVPCLIDREGNVIQRIALENSEMPWNVWDYSVNEIEENEMFYQARTDSEESRPGSIGYGILWTE